MRTALALTLILSAAAQAAAAPSAAVADAERWVALVDAGDYAASWSASGSIFRERLTSEAWAGAVGPVRKPLGAVLSRTLLKEQTAKTLPGASDGDYDVVQFSTTFANKKVAIETIVMAHEPAGWRVDGYFVK